MRNDEMSLRVELDRRELSRAYENESFSVVLLEFVDDDDEAVKIS